MDIRKLIDAGQAAQNAEHAAKEVAKRGNLRGGSAGCVSDDGNIYGECHRIALARMLGQDKIHDANRHIMFDSGLASEDIWAEKLRAAGVVFRREEEIPVVWKVPGHDKIVTGRPDIVIGEMDGDVFKPLHGLELKGVFSASTGAGVELEGRPNSKNLVQAAFYSMALGNLPYTLCYTSAGVIDLAYWAQKKFGVKKLQPFYRFFYLEWRDNTLWYRDEQQTTWIETRITHDGLAAYFQLVSEMEATKVLGPRPSSDHVNGDTAKYNGCDYCDRKDACATYDNDGDFDKWLIT